MSRERYSTSYAQTSHGRPLIQRAFTVLLIITALTLLLLARAQHPVVASMRAQMLDTITPIADWLAQPVSGVRGLIRDKNALFNTFEANKQLRAENDTLRHWQAVAQALKAENDALRALAGYSPVSNVSYVTARVIGQSPGSYASTLTLNVGAQSGIKQFQPVVDAFGLVGRVTDIGEHTARVLLLSDSSSRIPVVTANARIHAIANGTGDEMLRLTFLGGDASDVALGEQIVTTEEGGLMPGGIILGTVFKRDADGLLVKPIRPLAHSEYVRIIATK